MLVLLAIAASTRTPGLSDVVSRDGRYRVVVAESPRHRITFDIVTQPGGSILHRVVSNYQPYPDTETLARHEPANVEVYWSPESNYVAIDEAAYHHGGEVFLAEMRRGKTREVGLPREAIVAATGRQWDRYRIRVEEGWVSEEELSLTLGGDAVQSYLPDGRHTLLNRTFEVRLWIHEGRATLTSCRETTKS